MVDEELSNGMATSTEVLAALRELANAKQLERSELIDLLRDGIHAALVKRYGPTVRAEIDINELDATIRVAVLRTVVEAVEDPASQVSLEEARRAGRQAADYPAGARRRTDPHPRGVRGQGGRVVVRRNPADRAREAGHHDQPLPRGGGHHSLSRAEPPRALPPG